MISSVSTLFRSDEPTAALMARGAGLACVIANDESHAGA
ncbi:hypothetical protein BN2497_2331 [Janthinobacterium sp. CG23_2]|nr:hypothetical protein BN2497_2331 [Janthinobacterium sp. CG23_2]CUU27563.1 hypothetical protein BN3177_2331 [Janthinobacterium sp. CG23_2]